MPRFTRRVPLPLSPAELYDWHLRPGAFQRLVPPWERIRILDPGPGVADGSRLRMRVPLAGPITRTWIAEHRDLVPGRQFRDVQISGPFARWEHTHRMLPAEQGEGPAEAGAEAPGSTTGTSILEDDITYALPLGAVGAACGGRHVERQLARMFAYRHAVMRIDAARHARARNQGVSSMRVLITGASGLVGRALTAFLTTGGHSVTCLGRGPSRLPGTASRTWDPDSGRLNPQDVEGFDAVVHLAGENIAAGRWTAERKRRIRESRVGGTRLLAEALARAKQPPGVFVSASALGYYGDRGDAPLPEDAPPGSGFLPEVCVAWEQATEGARTRGIRTVLPRIGLVLSPAGGALASMLPVFRFGLGGRLGGGDQYMSWISLDDMVGVLHHALITPSLAGPVNAVSPHPVTNREFTRVLGRVLGRPTLFPVPRAAARLLMGEMADALLFASTRLVPEKLAESGFEFAHSQLEPALRHVLGR